MEIVVYTEILNITNEVALPFWACAEVSLGNGANGTVLDVVTVDVEFSTLAEFVLGIGFVIGIGLATGVELSGIADDGITDGEGYGDGYGDGESEGYIVGGIDDCSGNGANGTPLGEYGGFTLLMIGAWATVGCSLLASGTATVVMGSAAAKAILFINNFKYIAKIRSTN